MSMDRYRDSDHTYLILPAPEDTRAGSYPYRMLAANRIRGLLPCALRTVDGEDRLCYDITARQRFSLFFEGRALQYAYVRRLVRDLCGLRRELADYLLDVDRLLLTEEYIYYDLFEERFLFLYYPDGEERDPAAFFEALSERAPDDDREAAGLLLRLGACAGQPDLFFRRMEELEHEREEDARAEGEPAELWEEDAAWESDPVWPEEGGKETVMPGTGAGREGDGQREDSKGLLTVAALLLLLCVGAAAWPVLLPADAQVLFRCRCVAVMSFVSALVTAAVWRIFSAKGRREGLGSSRFPGEAARAEQEGDVPARGKKTAQGTPASPERFDTVYLGFRGKEAFGLYSADGSSPHIDLHRLPLTVGRMAEHADMVLEDPSVSRMHVRFSRDESGRLCMQDLNSTNGTWLNGRLLEPEERVPVDKGDAVRIGALEYHCR